MNGREWTQLDVLAVQAIDAISGEDAEYLTSTQRAERLIELIRAVVRDELAKGAEK